MHWLLLMFVTLLLVVGVGAITKATLLPDYGQQAPQQQTSPEVTRWMARLRKDTGYNIVELEKFNGHWYVQVQGSGKWYTIGEIMELSEQGHKFEVAA